MGHDNNRSEQIDGDVMKVWAAHLGVDLTIATYAQFVQLQRCDVNFTTCNACDSSEADFCHACQVVGVGGAEDTTKSTQSSPLDMFYGQVSTAGDSFLSPLYHGLYETGFDNQWCANASMNDDDDPSYKQAISGGEKMLWEDSMLDEMANLRRFDVFEEVDEDTVLGWNGEQSPFVTETLWVLKRKRGSNNEITKRKSRCVFNDKRRKDRELIETFSPAIRHTTVKCAIAVSCILKRKRVSFDVTGAYLQGRYETTDKPVYARPPPGQRTFTTRTTKSGKNIAIVWRMKAPLYGQGDAGLVWFKTLRKQLVEHQKFNGSEWDPSYFWKRY